MEVLVTGVTIPRAPLLVGEEIRCAAGPVQIQCHKMEASLVMVQHLSPRIATPSPVQVNTINVLMTENLCYVSNLSTDFWSNYELVILLSSINLQRFHIWSKESSYHPHLNCKLDSYKVLRISCLQSSKVQTFVKETWILKFYAVFLKFYSVSLKSWN